MNVGRRPVGDGGGGGGGGGGKGWKEGTYRFQLWISCPRASVSSMFQELSTNFETTRKLTFGRS